MRIAHLTATYPPYFGGTGNVAQQNARSLAKLGHDVTVFTARVGQSRTERDVAGVEVRRFRPLLRIGNAPLLPELLALRRHDIVHLHYPFIFGAEMMPFLRRIRGQHYVLTYHNDLISPGIKGTIFKIYERAWAGRVLTEARRVIVTNWDGAAASAILGPLMRQRPRHFIEVPNAIDTSLFTPMDAEAGRRQLDIPPGRPVILFVGAMDSAHHPKGGVPVLLEAVARLNGQQPTVVLVGGGDRIADYRELAESLGLAARVRFTGQIEHHRMPRVYAAASVVVQPSQLFEPFGLVAVEAMACARPVIVSDLPGVRRVVAGAGGGLLARPGDADDVARKIELVLRDANLAVTLANAGRSAVVSRYDLGPIGPALENVYLEAIRPA